MGFGAGGVSLNCVVGLFLQRGDEGSTVGTEADLVKVERGVGGGG